MSFDEFELWKRGLSVDYLYVRADGWPRYRWFHGGLPKEFHAAAYQEAMKLIVNGKPPPFAIPIVFKAPKFVTETCCA